MHEGGMLVKKEIFLITSFLCFLFSYMIHSSYLLIVSYILLLFIPFLKPRNITWNFLLFVFLSLGCFLIELPISGYLLIFVFMTLSITFSLFQSIFYKKYYASLGNSVEVEVLVGKLKQKKNISDIKIGDIVVIGKNQTCYLEGIITKGISRINLKKIIGVDEIHSVRKGDTIFSGSINLDREILVSVTSPFEESLFFKYISDFLKHKKSNFMRTIFPMWFLFLIQVVLLFVFFFLVRYQFHFHALEYGFMILMITFINLDPIYSIIDQLKIMSLREKGIYVLNRKKLLQLPKSKNLIFTKTGILTLGKFKVVDVSSRNEKKLLEVLSYAEYYSKNRIAICIHNYCRYKVTVDSSLIQEFKQFSNGVLAIVQKNRYLVGNYQFMLENGITVEKELVIGTNLYVAKNGRFLGVVTLSDQVDLSIKDSLFNIRKIGHSHFVTFSRDNETVTRAVSNTLGIYDCYSELTYKDRMFWIQYLKDIYGLPQAYISDEECIYPVDIKVLVSKNQSRGDFILTRGSISNLSFLYSYSFKYLSSMRIWVISMFFIKFLLYFLLLWIRDILVLGSILMGVVLFLLVVLLLSFLKNRKGD